MVRNRSLTVAQENVVSISSKAKRELKELEKRRRREPNVELKKALFLGIASLIGRGKRDISVSMALYEALHQLGTSADHPIGKILLDQGVTWHSAQVYIGRPELRVQDGIIATMAVFEGRRIKVVGYSKHALDTYKRAPSLDQIEQHVRRHMSPDDNFETEMKREINRCYLSNAGPYMTHGLLIVDVDAATEDYRFIIDRKLNHLEQSSERFERAANHLRPIDDED